MRAVVLAGGPSSEHEISLQTAAEMLRNLRVAGWSAAPVWIGRDGRWHLAGEDDDLDRALAAEGREAAEVLPRLGEQGAVAVLGLHGRFGEDGEVQRLLDAAGVPYTGSGAAASALCMDKELSKLAATRVGAVCARHDVLTGEAVAAVADARVAHTVGRPCVVKPVGGGSSVATTIVREGDDLPAAVRRAQAEDPQGRALVEEHVAGVELTCAVLRRDGEVRCLPLVAIEPAGDAFYDYHAKYEDEATRFTCPAPVPDAVRREVERVSRALYEQLDLRGVARLDFLLDGRRGLPVFLEVNTLPGMTSHSLVPLAAREAGIDGPELMRLLVADVEGLEAATP